MTGYYSQYLKRLATSLETAEWTNLEKNNLGPVEGLHMWQTMTQKAAAAGKSIYFIGNGASAAMSSHMSADATKNGKLKAKCLNDAALTTAISNDIDYKSVFSLQLERYAEAGDLLFTISSSGNSPNVIAAIQTAREKKMGVVTLSGMKPGNASRSLGDLNVYLPADRYGIVESGHQAVLHCWLDNYLNSIGIDM